MLFPGLEMPKVVDLAQCKSLGRLVGLGSGVDWQAKRPVQDSHAAAVIHMVVGDQHGIDRIRIPAMLGEPPLDLAGTDPGVEQQLDAACLDVDAIAVAAGLEGDDPHGDIVPQVTGRGNRQSFVASRDAVETICSPWFHRYNDGMNTPNETHSVLVGYILWIFGFTGSHRFYYGKPITGTIWFFTLGLVGIGWIIDLFLIPGMARRADLRYQAGPLDYTVAWILLTFLGIFGIHRFYMGKWITGIIYLLTGGLVGIGLLYDLWTLNGQVSEMNRRGLMVRG